MIKNNTVYNEDCLNTMSRMKDGSIDLVLTSPPYDSIPSCKIKTKMRSYTGYKWNCSKIAKEVYRILKNNRCCVWIVGDETKNFCENLASFKQAIYFVEECGFNLLDTMIYKKSGGPPQYPGMRRYPQRFEYMFVFCKGKPGIYNPIKDVKNKYAGTINKGSTQRQKDGTTKFCGDYKVPKFSVRGNVWEYATGKNLSSVDPEHFEHPATFPEALCSDHVKSWSNVDDIVYDPFGGSGTTGVVSYELNRKFILSEISSKYCEVIKRRFSRRCKMSLSVV